MNASGQATKKLQASAYAIIIVIWLTDTVLKSCCVIRTAVSINPRPVGVCRATCPVWGAILPPPPKISRTTQRSDKRQTELIALDVNPLRHVSFLKIEVTSQVKRRSKVRYYYFLLWRLLRPCQALYFFFLSERSLDSNRKVQKCPWDGAKQRSGQG